MSWKTLSDRYRLEVLRDGPVTANLGDGYDDVLIKTHDDLTNQVRLTFSRAEVGNGNVNNSLPGDGGLAARVQAEDDTGSAVGPVSRFDDEGITFRTQSPHVKIDVRDLNPAVSLGLFDVAVLGTSGADDYDFSRKHEDYYVNGGAGDDWIEGGRGNDYLIGGAGNDYLSGSAGDDVLVGAPGNDFIDGGDGDDTAVVRYTLDGSDQVDLGSGNDIVQVIFPAGQVRLTWSTLQTGDGNPNDSGTLTNEDGGLNIRFQAEDSAGDLVGPVSRYDDEGISFIGAPGVTFDLRNLPDGAVRGSGYGVARFGSDGDDVYDDSARSVNVFHNGGLGNDHLIGGSGADHLVGLGGDDRIEGGAGDDLLVGLTGVDTFVFSGTAGRDTILTYETGTDRIDLSAYSIGIENVQATQVGPNTLINVDSNKDGVADFEIFLGGSAPPAVTDYVF
jgi:Ca2+-binding RTX toxin-like protein